MRVVEESTAERRPDSEKTVREGLRQLRQKVDQLCLRAVRVGLHDVKLKGTKKLEEWYCDELTWPVCEFTEFYEELTPLQYWHPYRKCMSDPDHFHRQWDGEWAARLVLIADQMLEFA